jgi:CubicO group peptidase (beta-lactamase class C family)
LFDAASLTKSFTSALAAVLVEQGLLRWDDPVRRHLPRLDLGDPYLTANVTLRDFLSHRTGLEAINETWYFNNASREELLGRLRFFRRVVPFRTGLVYSNVGYTVAGHAIAAAGGGSWDEQIRTRLLVPLGMNRTTARFVDAGSDPNIASPHAAISGVQRPIARERMARDVTAPAGAVQSSAHDLARWLRFQMNGGLLDGRRIVAEAELKETQSPQIIVPTTPAFRRARQLEFGAAYGMGWQVWDFRGRPMLWHTGSGNGQLAYMAIYPRDSLGVVVLINSWVTIGVPPVHGGIAGCIAEALLAVGQPNCVGEARTRRAADQARFDASSRTILAQRIPNAPPTRPLAAYAGTYADSVLGDFQVRIDRDNLTLRVGDRGDLADLTPWHFDTFTIEWRDPFLRQYNTSRLQFVVGPDGAVSAIRGRFRTAEVNALRIAAR